MITVRFSPLKWRKDSVSHCINNNSSSNYYCYETAKMHSRLLQLLFRGKSSNNGSILVTGRHHNTEKFLRMPFDLLGDRWRQQIPSESAIKKGLVTLCSLFIGYISSSLMFFLYIYLKRNIFHLQASFCLFLFSFCFSFLGFICFSYSSDFL